MIDSCNKRSQQKRALSLTIVTCTLPLPLGFLFVIDNFYFIFWSLCFQGNIHMPFLCHLSQTKTNHNINQADWINFPTSIPCRIGSHIFLYYASYILCLQTPLSFMQLQPLHGLPSEDQAGASSRHASCSTGGCCRSDDIIDVWLWLSTGRGRKGKGCSTTTRC